MYTSSYYSSLFFLNRDCFFVTTHSAYQTHTQNLVGVFYSDGFGVEPRAVFFFFLSDFGFMRVELPAVAVADGTNDTQSVDDDYNIAWYISYIAITKTSTVYFYLEIIFARRMYYMSCGRRAEILLVHMQAIMPARYYEGTLLDANHSAGDP